MSKTPEQLRFERKLTASRRAQFRLKQTHERIDWELDVLAPELEEYRVLGKGGVVPRITVESEA